MSTAASDVEICEEAIRGIVENGDADEGERMKKKDEQKRNVEEMRKLKVRNVTQPSPSLDVIGSGGLDADRSFSFWFRHKNDKHFKSSNKHSTRLMS